MRGIGVAIPIVLSQCFSLSMHYHNFCAVTPNEIALDVTIANAIYVADRLDKHSSSVHNLTSYASMLIAMSELVSDEWTRPLAPAVPILHHGYSSCKRLIAPLKPAVVSIGWTAVSYIQPLLIRHDENVLKDVALMGTLFFMYTAVSVAADIPDIIEDKADGILSPAVLLGEENAFLLVLALIAAGISCHADETTDVVPYLCYDFVVISYVGLRRKTASDVVVFSCFVFYVHLTFPFLKEDVMNFTLQILSTMLRSSDVAHQMATNMIPWLIEHTERLPPNVQKTILKVALQTLPLGDEIGHNILIMYSDVVQRVYKMK